MRSIDSNLYLEIIKEIKKNPEVTQVMLANNYGVSERTIRRYIKDLKDNNIIILSDKGKKRKWRIRDLSN